MFIGHYAAGFLIKRKAKDIPLWLLFLAVQFVDILWVFLFSLGIERASFDITKSFFLRPSYDYYPFSHSLFTNLIIAMVIYLVIRKYKNKKWAFWISIAVLSHWFLDIIVHTQDIPLYFDKFKIGLGLWRYPLASMWTEIIFLGMAAFIYLWEHGNNTRLHIRLIIFLLITYGVYIASYFVSAAAPTNSQIIISSLVLLFSISFGGYLIERK